jgi:hypothetical protein
MRQVEDKQQQTKKNTHNKNITRQRKTISNTDPTNKPGVNPGDCKGYAFPAFFYDIRCIFMHVVRHWLSIN